MSRTPVTITISLGHHVDSSGALIAHLVAYGARDSSTYGSLWNRDVVIPGTTAHSPPSEMLRGLSAALDQALLRGTTSEP